ncbi:uncharacterized protein LOC134692507 [Mytilus trossulus]|uniref:uncharacterized protein LOC134692507 n=1 Tax=Mytilus trossulus TaxID=6551 RepID=UPI003004777E
MKIMFVLTVVWTFSLQGIISTEMSDGSALDVGEVKRLLLPNPDVVGARLAELDRASQEMKKQMAELKENMILTTNTMAQVKTQLSQEKTMNDNLMSSFTQLQSSFDQEKAKRVNLEAVTSQISASIQKVSDYGSTYTRWGRKQCSGIDTDLVYTGFTAGQSHFDSDFGTRFGGASNLLCLPNNPEMSNKSAPGYSYLYGTEYQQTFFGSGAVDEDVPCALCRSKHTYSSVMIPGRKSCYSGWKLEYYGYIASDSYTQKASSFICVDASPEFVQGGKANKDGSLLYGTGTKCGSLPCPPYDNNFAVLCVVCSK